METDLATENLQAIRSLMERSAVYRRALAEIDDLADRELIAEDERRAARTEAARRLITAADGEDDAAVEAAPSSSASSAATRPPRAAPPPRWHGRPRRYVNKIVHRRHG